MDNIANQISDLKILFHRWNKMIIYFSLYLDFAIVLLERGWIQHPKMADLSEMRMCGDMAAILFMFYHNR